MDERSYTLMNEEIESRVVPNLTGVLKVLDVASYDVNGTFRPLIEGRGWQYLGIDIRPGPNVDMVVRETNYYPLVSESFDLALCGNALHNIAYPYITTHEMVRLVRPGGFVIIIAPIDTPIGNRYPRDYWRILPDGLERLFDSTNKLTDYSISIKRGLLVGSGRRRTDTPTLPDSD